MPKKKYVVDKKKKNKKKSIKTITIEGYSMAKKNHKFYIKGDNVSNIVVSDEELVKKLVIYKVEKQYKQLINKATEILASDDDDNASGSRLILDEVERFRQQIKNKYKEYLEKEELMLMAKQLTIIKKAAKEKEQAIISELNEEKKGNKSK
ncbi:MAG: hypothetical protein IJH13_02015 [Bacilli bacterium]|nr:hypothetical protein [Bacilli bacterium]